MRARRPGATLLARCAFAALVAVSTIVAGCGFGADYTGTLYQCGEGERCPDGFQCIDGYCRTSAPDGGGDDDDDGGIDPDGGLDPDGGPGIDAGPGWQPSGCGTLSLLQDDFTESAVGRQWNDWSDFGVTTGEVGGNLVIDLAAGAGDVYGGYTASQLHDLTGGALEATVLEVGGQNTILEIRHEDGGRAQLVAENGMLAATVFDVPGAGTRIEIPYVPAQHRHWRMREDGGSLYWETSPDRTIDSWTELHAEPLPFPAVDVRGILAAGGQLAAASAARFDDVNGDAPDTLRYCPTASFSESFDATPLDPTWDYWEESGCNVAEVGGALEMTFDGTGNAFCGLETAHLFDLRGSDVVFDVSGAGDAPMFLTYVQVVLPRADSTHLEITNEQDYLGFVQRVNGIVLDEASVTYSATTHRYWRISEIGGNVTFWTSPDGSTWAPRLTADPGFDLSAVQILIGAGHYSTGPGFPVESTIGSVNPP